MEEGQENGQENGQQEQAPAIVQTSVADLLGGLVDTSTLKDLEDIDSKKTDSKAKPAENQNGAENPDDQDDGGEEEGEEDDAEEEEEGDEPEDKKDKADPKKSDKKKEEAKEAELKNKFGIKLGKKEEKPGSKLSIKSYDEIPSVLKTKYGQEIKDIKDLPKFFENSVDKWRADSQNLEKVTKEKENAIAVFENLPPEMLEAIQLHYSGEDYRKALDAGPKIDFSKPVEKQDVKTLVNTFYPGEFSDADFEADEQSKELKIAIKASEKEYNSTKIAKEQRAKEHVEKVERQNTAYKTSVSSSVDFLKTAFPDMAKDDLVDVEQTLSSGQLMSKFLNPDGTYKQDAAKKLMLAEHGEELILQLMEIAQRRGESKANEDIVERAAERPKHKNSKGGTELRKEVTEKVEQLIPGGLLQKKTF